MAAILGLVLGPGPIVAAAAQAAPPVLAQAPAEAPDPPLPPRASDDPPQAPPASPLPDERAAGPRRVAAPAGGPGDKGPSGTAVASAPLPVPRPDRAAAPPPLKPDALAGAATGKVPLDSAALIGVMTLNSGRTALLRLGTGAIHRLGVGDMVEGWRVSAIGKDSLRLSRESENRTFLLVGQ